MKWQYLSEIRRLIHDWNDRNKGGRLFFLIYKKNPKMCNLKIIFHVSFSEMQGQCEIQRYQ